MALGLFLPGVAAAEDWPHWRGPRMNGVSTETDAPTQWSATENVVWRRELPGPAGSTPIAVGGKVFLTTVAEEELALDAYDAATGELVWRRTVSVGADTFRGDEGNLASPSPSTDGEHVVAAMGDGRMACYTVDGRPVWKVDLSDKLGTLDIQFGYASTPIVSDGRVYLQWIHGDGDPATHEARAACLDLANGDTLWSTRRVTQARDECEHAYSSPILAGEGANRVFITHGADYVVAYDPDSGQERWRLGGLNRLVNYHSTLRFVASPAAADGLVIAPTAKKGAVAAIALGGRGDLTGESHERWRLSGGTPDVPSPIIDGGLVYLCGENGNLTCLNAANGDRVYRKRTVADRHRASPLLAGGKLYLTSRRGVITVVRAGSDFEVLATNDLGEPMSSSPIVSNGVLYLRTFEALYAIAETDATGG